MRRVSRIFAHVPRVHVILKPYFPSPSPSPSPSQDSPSPSPSTPPPSPSAPKIKTLVRKYGALAIAVHLSVYSATLAGIYIGVSAKLINVEHVIEWVRQSYYMDKWFGELADKNSSAGDFAAAWIITKFTEPIRLPMTAYLTPKLAKHPIMGRFQQK